MDAINNLILFVGDNGMRKTVYDVFFALGFVSVMTGLIWFGKKLELPLRKIVITVLIVYPIIVLWMFTMFWIESGFRSWGGNNIVRVFVYVPLVGLPVAKYLKIDKEKMLSLLSFGPLLVHGISHFGCVFFGCCAGYPCAFGIINPVDKLIRFPSQPIEAIAAVATVIYLFRRAKKRNYIPDGYEYPLMLTIFGLSRFLFEFLRDNRKLFLGCSDLSFHALFMTVVGIIWIVKKKEAEQALL